MTVMLTTAYPDGRVEQREATAEEIAELEARAEAARLDTERMEAEKSAREAARESAVAKLAALGLTEDEVQAIL